MKSISYKILAAYVTVLFFGGCVNFTKDHTRFKGKVIERNNASLESVKLLFVSQREEFLNSRTIRRDTVELGFDNSFEYAVNSDEENINSINISLISKKDNNLTFEQLSPDLFDCPPFDNCLNFDTGKKYEFDIYVTLPEVD